MPLNSGGWVKLLLISKCPSLILKQSSEQCHNEKHVKLYKILGNEWIAPYNLECMHCDDDWLSGITKLPLAIVSMAKIIVAIVQMAKTLHSLILECPEQESWVADMLDWFRISPRYDRHLPTTILSDKISIRLDTNPGLPNSLRWVSDTLTTHPSRPFCGNDLILDNVYHDTLWLGISWLKPLFQDFIHRHMAVIGRFLDNGSPKLLIAVIVTDDNCPLCQSPFCLV